MSHDPHSSPSADNLRRRAEERLHAKATEHGMPRSDADAQRLLHELQVHQVELEMQNEELQRTRNEMETGLLMFTELYDFAPIGYLTVDRSGIIRDANLAAASLLGVDRSHLLKRRLEMLLAAAARTDLAALLAKVFASETREVCVVPFLEDGPLFRWAQIEAAASTSGQECRLAVMEITASKRAEAERERLIKELQAAQARVKQLSGLLPICASCKKIRDDDGYWRQIETYIQSHSEAFFSHGICPECAERLYPGMNQPPPGGQTKNPKR